MTLDGMDTRTPVPLVPMMANHQKQNMRDHLLTVQAIAQALAATDFSAIEQAVGRIGYSDTIADAAKKRDPDAVLAALTLTLATCTSCHATYKQQVVDDSTWTSLTQQTAPSSPMHH